METVLRDVRFKPNICSDICDLLSNLFSEATEQKFDDGIVIIDWHHDNDWAVVAGFDVFDDEDGTSTRNPEDINRSSKLEAAIVWLLDHVYSDTGLPDDIWMRLFQAEEEIA